MINEITHVALFFFNTELYVNSMAIQGFQIFDKQV